MPVRPAAASKRQMAARLGTKWGSPRARQTATIWPMKGLIVFGLWTIAGWDLGGTVEWFTGLRMTFPVLAAFVVVGIYLAVRIRRTTRSTNVSRILPVAEPDERLAA